MRMWKNLLYILLILMTVMCMLVNPILAIGKAYDLGLLTGDFLAKRIILIVMSRFVIGVVNGIYDR